MKKLFVLLAIIAVICTGCFSPCENCKELRRELSSAEDTISELRMRIEDNELDSYGDIEDIIYYFGWAEEYLSGQFEDVDVDEALKAVREGMNYCRKLR